MTVGRGLAIYLRTRRARRHFRFGRPSQILLVGHKYGSCEVHKAKKPIKAGSRPYSDLTARMESYPSVFGANLDD